MAHVLLCSQGDWRTGFRQGQHVTPTKKRCHSTKKDLRMRSLRQGLYVDDKTFEPSKVRVSKALLRPNKTYVGDALYQQQGSIVGETREKTHVCADCGKSYAAKRSLWRHRKFECVNAKPKFSCEKCSYKSPHKWRMDTHRKMVHGFFPTG